MLALFSTWLTATLSSPRQDSSWGRLVSEGGEGGKAVCSSHLRCLTPLPFFLQLELITTQATKAGFSGGMVVDYPNSAKAKK